MITKTFECSLNSALVLRVSELKMSGGSKAYNIVRLIKIVALGMHLVQFDYRPDSPASDDAASVANSVSFFFLARTTCSANQGAIWSIFFEKDSPPDPVRIPYDR